MAASLLLAHIQGRMEQVEDETSETSERNGARGASTRVVVALCVVMLVAVGYGVFGALVPPRTAVPAWLALLFGSGAALLLAGRWLAGAPLSERRFTLVVVVCALALRLGALVAPVSLSDDVHRYLWDGTLLSTGHDPYASRPTEVVDLPHLGERRLSELNSPEYHTVYPPLAQLTFAAAAGLARATGLPGTRLLRALFVAVDLLSVLALLGLLRRFYGDGGRAWGLVYAFSPFVVWEIAAGGHTEALAVPLLLLTVRAALEARPGRAGLLFGLAASAKLTVLVMAPVLLAHLVRRVGVARAAVFSATSFAALAVGFVPFFGETLWPNLSGSLALYSTRFSFNAPLYYAARSALGYVEGVTDSVDPLLVPWLGLATLTWLTGTALSVDGERRRTLSLLVAASLGYLLLSRVMHPWYLLPVLALSVLARSRAAVVLAALVPLSYLRYDPLGFESPYVMAAQLVGFGIALAWDARLDRASTAARSSSTVRSGLLPSRDLPRDARR